MDDLISEFITETTESLATLDLELVKLEQNPNDADTLGNIFRLVHTIKGTCGFLGLARLESVAHASENVLGKIRDGELQATPGAISLVLTSLDNIKGLVDYLSQHGQEQEGDDSTLIATLNTLADKGEIDGGTTASPTSATPTGPQLVVQSNPESEAAVEVADIDPSVDFSAFFKGDDELTALIQEQKAKQTGGPVAAATKPAPIASAPVKTPDTKPDAAATSKSAAPDASIRVSIDVLENLMQMVSELVLTRNQLMQILRTNEDKNFLAPIQQLSHITTELQEGVMKTRMQPIGNAWSKFPRLVRDLSLELGKKIDLQMKGAETELDRQLLEMIKDPLTHMVRNSCDHGLEMPSDRKATGKSETGTVTLSAYHEGGHIIIDIVDDGKGINIERVKEKIVANGLASQAEVDSLSDQQIMQYIFRAGFSTAEKVTSVSGRGVGMDVVRTNIEKIGGTINLSSEVGKGSTFSIKIPLTLAIVSVMIVESGNQKFAIPQINVLELVRVVEGSDYRIETINGAPVMRLREKLLPLRELGSILKLQEPITDWENREAFVVVCKVGNFDFGLIVDRVFDTEEIVVKPVAQALKGIPVYAGNTILGDGSVIMILDPNGLARGVGNVDSGNSQQDTAAAQEQEQRERKQNVSFILFSSGKGAPKAVPLELISRLEEIEVSSIELANDMPVVQYRGDLMPLVMLDEDTPLPNEGMVQIIVFTYDNKSLGLVVENILDIIEAPFDIKMTSKNENMMGSMVLAGKATDVVDAGKLLTRVMGMVDMSDVNVQEAKSRHLLLVEDSPFFRDLTVPFLAAVGYQVTAVEHGADALKALLKAPDKFDLVVTDIEMPVMNGYEFTAACRSQPTLANLPIIAYTASISEDVITQAKKSGVSDCIVKTDRPRLLEVIGYFLNSQEEMAA